MKKTERFSTAIISFLVPLAVSVSLFSCVTVKLYTDRELLRQRTYPILERQFTAWGESNESLKIYSCFPTVAPYEGAIRHELAHHITLKMSANRLPS